ncbi:hypothetical protein E2C01_049523 [Portunus trituberculatus]|uniref:Uncharacterized protein n=1 Tax=Portunus trituberculatus TaxID=210409 RepID=A0A5B7G6M1_PORTR|nr:hypothetical protein [Portunus trituberculatus]
MLSDSIQPFASLNEVRPLCVDLLWTLTTQREKRLLRHQTGFPHWLRTHCRLSEKTFVKGEARSHQTPRRSTNEAVLLGKKLEGEGEREEIR